MQTHVLWCKLMQPVPVSTINIWMLFGQICNKDHLSMAAIWQSCSWHGTHTHTHKPSSHMNEFVFLHLPDVERMVLSWNSNIASSLLFTLISVLQQQLQKKIARIKFCSSGQRKIINNLTICRKKLVILLNILLNVCDSRFGSVHSTIFCCRAECSIDRDYDHNKPRVKNAKERMGRKIVSNFIAKSPLIGSRNG